MKVKAKIKLKEIPTEKLVAELLRRDNVQMYACDLYKENYRVHDENKAQAKEIAQLKELNEFLEEASAFFAARHRKSGKGKE